MLDNIFLQLSVLLGITVTVALIMRFLRQPLMVAYIVAGIIAGPLFLNILHGSEALFDAFAQFGIVLLLFIVGLSLNLEYIRRVGKSVFLATLIQFGLSVAWGFIFMAWVGLAFLPALFLSIAVSFSSTIIIVKLLTDKKDTEALYGRFAIGILLVQDIIAIIIMIGLSTINANDAGWYETLFVTLSKGIVLVGLVYLLARYVLPLVVDRVAHSAELLFIFTIAWCFGIASLVYAVGFSIEIGAIIAGISLGASPYQPLISSRIRPLRDFFIVLFFIVLGSEMQLTDIVTVLPPALLLSIFILIVDPVILYVIMRTFGYTRRNAFLASVTAAQVSEFGFILIFKAQSLGYVDRPVLAILTLVALITIVISSYLITYNEQLYQWVLPIFRFFGGEDRAQQRSTGPVHYEAWVFGYHRIGWRVCEALRTKGVKFAVVDFNPETIDNLRRRGIPAYFGDAADVEFLEHLSLDRAKLIISTLPAADDQKTLITHLRYTGSRALVIANLYDSRYLDELYAAGADYVMMPHLLGGAWMSEVLVHHRWTKGVAARLRREQADEMQLRFTTGSQP